MNTDKNAKSEKSVKLNITAGQNLMRMSDNHPFKSLKAKNKYLAFENKMVKEWPVVFEEKIVSTSYGQTFMRISGPVNGHPLVLLPGGSTNSMIWKANIKAFSSVYRTYALDNIFDFGRSVYIRKMKTHDDFTQWLDELFASLSLGQNLRIVGYSYGGWITGNYAVSHPQRLDRVILIAPAFSIQPITKAFIWDLILALLPFKYTRRCALYSSWKDLLKSGKEGKKVVDDQVEYFNLAMKSFKFKLGAQPNTLTDMELNKLTMPALYLIGEHDTVCIPKLAIERLNKVVPDIKTELISDTGHDLMFTHTDKVNKTMLNFLK
jgi:pimeloyl-ACP methyl ester carboxylesterase